jgi:hypothetical protein
MSSPKPPSTRTSPRSPARPSLSLYVSAGPPSPKLPPDSKLTIDDLRAKYELQDSDISALRHKKQKAIRSMDFDRSNAIQRIIDSLIDEDSDSVLIEYKTFLQESIDQVISEMNVQLEENKQNRRKIKTEYRVEVDAVFLNTQQKHIEEMAEIEERRLIDVLHEEHRGTANYRMATREARRLAKGDRVVAAIEMKELAEKTLEKEREERVFEVNRRYRTIIQTVTDRQMKELSIIEKELNKQLKENRRIKENVKKGIQQRTAVFIKNELRRAIAAACERLTKLNLRARVIAELTEFVEENLQNRHLSFLLVID